MAYSAAYQKAYYAKNREKKIQRSRAWYAANKERKCESAKQYVAKNRERIKAYQLRWRRANAESDRKSKRKYQLSVYGLTQEAFAAMVDKQKGLCVVCEKPLNAPCVDHDHKTGAVRGILHRRCNLLVGYFEASARPRSLMQNVADYLGIK
jgi:hypothetical protein